MSSDASVQVRNLSKCYQIYDRPRDRLVQMLLRGRRKCFRDFWALKDVCFSVGRGETVAIIGRNGSGKSTLLQLICGTLNPTAGEISVGGRIAALLELGAGFNRDFTGRENVYLNGALLGVSEEALDERFQAIVDFADIGDFLDQPVATYSSGMYVRLAFALAIHCDPEILVVDEALAVGDFLFQQKCNRFLKERFTGVTKLLVTHDMAAVANLADRALVLNHGELIHDGDPQSAIREYQIAARAEERRKLIGANGHSHAPARPQPDETAARPVLSNWMEIPETRLSGTLRVKIRRCAWAIDGVAGALAIRDGERIRIEFEVAAQEPIDAPIVGYQFQDQFGNAVFGENTVTSGILVPKMGAGLSRLCVEFEWPVLADGKYSLTLGMGSGHDSLNHSIECWAHNIFVISSSASAPVHGLFNVKIANLTFAEVCA